MRWVKFHSISALVLLGGIAGIRSTPVAAQATRERATFYLLSHTPTGSDTVVAERVERTSTRLDGELLSSTGARTAYTASLAPTGLITHLEVRSYRGPRDTVGASASFDVGGDSIVAKMGAAEPAHLPGAPGTLIVVNPSMASFEQMLIHAKAMNAAGQPTFPVFIVGAPSVVPLTVTWVGSDSAEIRYANVSLRLAMLPGGHLAGGAMPARGLTIIRSAWLPAFASAKPDYSAPPNAPYTAEDVVVTTSAGLKLNGTITIPKGRVGGRAPAIVTITGSGSEDRDEQPVATLKGYRPFRELADTLGRRGIAVLRLDDRGVNGSDVGPPTQTSNDYADDIRAGVAYLRSRPEIDPSRIGLVGHSEGGIIGPIVATTDPRICAIVIMAGTASPGRDILSSQQHYMIDTVLRLTGDKRAAALEQSQRATDSLERISSWMKEFLNHDPSTIARSVKTPVLILQGLADHQVPASEAEKLAAAFREGGNTHVTVRKFPATDHLFLADSVGSFDYAKLPSLHVRPAVLTAIADWLSAQFK